jgi:PKD repeat protein
MLYLNTSVRYSGRHHFKQVWALLILTLLSVSGIPAQSQPTKDPVRCATTLQYHQQRMLQDPEYARHVSKHLTQLKNTSLQRNPDCSSGPVIIPVAVHFDDGVVPAGQEDCAISLVNDQITALNNEINGNDPQNTAYANLQSCFPGSPEIGSSCIEFCIANYNHPPGYNLVEGEPAITIGQIDFSQTVGSGSSVPIDANWSGYLNIFVGNLSGGLLGQAAGIPGQFNGEGVVIEACTFGTGNVDCTGMNSSASCGGIYNEGNTLTHEVGHYLGLFHIWGDNSLCTGNQDYIDDTPGMNSNYSGYTNCNDNNCDDLPESCETKDMYMNYMSYAGDACMYMFTSDQSDVMHQSASNAGFSNSLPDACAMPEFPVANFSFVPDPVELCLNHAFIQFSDASTGPPTTWNWTFDGLNVNPSSSSEKNPEVNVSEAGTLTVTLVVSNLAGESLPYSENIDVTFLEENDPLCDLCTYSLYLNDSYGDGWNGAELELLLDGESQGTYTISSGSSSNYDFTVVQDQNIELIFSGGSWDSEVSLDLIDSYGYVIFHQGSNPPDGSIYNDQVSCEQPTCEDGIQNGNETAVDCGGNECPECPTCGSTFVDSGGSGGFYSNGEDLSWTFCPDNPGEAINLQFSEFSVEPHESCGYDVLKIFNGTDNSQLLGSYCGSLLPPEHHSTTEDGCLYVEFSSDNYVVGEGWEALITCEVPCSLTVSDGSSNGSNTLSAALECANPGDSIFIDPSLANTQIDMSASTLVLDKDLVIIDPSQSLVLQGYSGGSALVIEANTTVTLDGISISGQSIAGLPVVSNSGNLTLRNLNVADANPDTTGEFVSNSGTLVIEGEVAFLKE